MAAIGASKVKRQRKESRNKRERASDSASTIHSSQLHLIHNHRFNSKEDDHEGRHFEVRDRCRQVIKVLLGLVWSSRITLSKNSIKVHHLFGLASYHACVIQGSF